MKISNQRFSNQRQPLSDSCYQRITPAASVECFTCDQRKINTPFKIRFFGEKIAVGRDKKKMRCYMLNYKKKTMFFPVERFFASNFFLINVKSYLLFCRIVKDSALILKRSS